MMFYVKKEILELGLSMGSVRKFSPRKCYKTLYNSNLCVTLVNMKDALFGLSVKITKDGEESDGGGVFGFHGVGDPCFVVVVFFLDIAFGAFFLIEFVLFG